MTALPRPEKIITHESDLDGLLAGVLLQRVARASHGVEAPLEAYHYNVWKQRELREKAAWVTDFSFEARLDKPNWLVVDHHVTEATTPARATHPRRDQIRRPALLRTGREHGLGSPALARLVHLNNVSDLFLEDDPDFVLAGDYANLVKVYGFWNLHTLLKGQIEKLVDHPLLEVMAAKRRIEDPLGFEWSKNNVAEISPTVGFVDTIIGNNNLIVHQLLEQGATRYPVLITMFRRTNGVVIASLRSRNGEAIKVAEKIQGGGHANACGAVLPRSVKSVPDGVQYLRQVLNPKKNSPLNSLESLFAVMEQVDKS